MQEKQQFEQELGKLLRPEQIRREEPLSRHTTFRVGGAAEYLVTPELGQIPQVVALCKRYDLPLTVIGNGSNLLIAEQPQALRSQMRPICSYRRAHCSQRRQIQRQSMGLPAWNLRQGYLDRWVERS